jgi:hypothetical protein
MEAVPTDPSELILDVNRQVEEIRRSAHSLLETVIYVRDAAALKSSIESALKKTYADLAKLRSSDLELETRLQKFYKSLEEQSTADAAADAAREKRCMVAREALEARLGEVLHVAALEFDAKRPSQPKWKSGSTDFATGPSLLHGVLERVKRVSGGSVQISLMDSYSAVVEAQHATQIQLKCPDMLTAVVSLSQKGCPDPVRVVAYAAEESDPQAWGSSVFLAHRRISALATRALGFYLSRAQALGVPGKPAAAGAEAIEDLLLWLCSYTDLFTAPCSVTGCLLASDLSTQLLLPPLVRPFKVKRTKLRQMAADPSAREPCHLHITPFAQF